MSKGQIAGQAFVYIFALIITMGVIAFGYRTIIFLEEKSKQADETMLIQQLTGDISYARSYGTQITDKTYALPPGYTKICFADKKIGSQNIPQNIPPLVADNLKTSSEANTFFYAYGKIKPFYIKEIKLKASEPAECIDAKNRIVRLDFTGCGEKTVVQDHQNNQDTTAETICQ